MKLQEVSNFKSFTLIEIIIVVALIALFAGGAVFFGINFYKEHKIEEEASSLTEVIKTAQSRAIEGKLDSDWGIKIFNEQGYYVLFPLLGANSFDDPNRDTSYDEVFNFTPGTEVTGATEIIFEKFTGKPIIK